MKKLIAAAALTLTAAAAQAEPFAFERQFGTAELFPTLTGVGYVAPESSSANTSVNFPHVISLGTPALYPTLVSQQHEASDNGRAHSGERFSYWSDVWNTSVEIGG